MIPKIIHYCWFGKNKKGDINNYCIETWKKVMPDYKLIEWNESNFDVDSCMYTRQAYDCKKWAFVSDYVRLYALYNCGGVYFDTDVEVLKTLDSFLCNEAFTGYEVNDCPITAVMGAEKGNRLIFNLMNYYKDKVFINADGSYNEITNTIIITNMMRNYGLRPDGKMKEVMGLVIYPQLYFCPNNMSLIWKKTSEKSYTIHHFDSSWRSKNMGSTSIKGRIGRYLIGFLRNHIGSEVYSRLSRVIKKFIYQ